MPRDERMAWLDRLANDAWRGPACRTLAGRVWINAQQRLRAQSATVGAATTALAVALEAQLAVQSLPYVPDPPGEDVYQSADETIARGGDCEDLAVLFVGLVRMLGATQALPLGAKVFFMPRPGAPQDHITALVRLARGPWLWAECSVRGARLGEYPPDAAAREARHRRELFSPAVP